MEQSTSFLCNICILLNFFALVSPDISEAVDILKSKIDSQYQEPCLLVSWVSKNEPYIITHNYARIHTYLKFNTNSTSSLKLVTPILPKFSEPCSLIIYRHGNITSSKFSKNSLINFHHNLPGGMLHSYHMIIITRVEEEHFISPEFSAPAHFRQFTNHILVSPKCSFYDMDSIWKLRKFPSSTPPSFRDRTNFHQNPMIWAFMKSRKRSLTRKKLLSYRESRSTFDQSLSFVTHMSRWFNATPAVNAKSSDFGFRDAKTGKWNGVAAEIISGRAHVSSWLTLTRDRANGMLFTSVGSTDGIIFFTALAKTGNENPIGNVLWGFAKSAVWILEMGMVVLMAGVVYVSFRMRSKGRGNRGIGFKYVAYVIGELLRATLDQPCTKMFNV